MNTVAPFWSLTPEQLTRDLGSGPSGLAHSEAARRLAQSGPNALGPAGRRGGFRLLTHQFRSPIALLLLTTAALSAFVGETTDSLIILIILLGSAGLGFWQERGASRAIDELLAMIRTTSEVRRDGQALSVPVEDVVPGDVVLLNAGDLVPADCRLVVCKDLAVDESALTGESFPALKQPAAVPPETPLGQRSSAVFMGTHVAAGTATALVINTGRQTLYGRLARDTLGTRRESEFERGVRRFGYFLLQITLVLVLIIFAVNVALARPVFDAWLFTLALAVGLTPQLLPAIVAITLSHGARRMARNQVVVRRLVAIEDFGGMSLLCTDKTGTLTEGRVRLHAALGSDGAPSDEVRRIAWLNARFQSGFDNPIDTAIIATGQVDIASIRKLDEVPYDFIRRRLSILIAEADGPPLLITKGAVPEVMAACTLVRDRAGHTTALEPQAAGITRLTDDLSQDGYRCLAIAVRSMPGAEQATRKDEQAMTLLGLLALADPPKPGIHRDLEELRALGVQIRMITGDNRLIAAHVAREVGLDADVLLTGAELDTLTDQALRQRAPLVHVFAEMDPNQKLRVIRALRDTGISVGYLGDGINDAAALQGADIGISVDTAVDVTRQAADIVLLRKDLGVLAEGIREGRRAFANTLKYVSITTSANFGNMFSMAGASLLAPFLPLLPKQILLLNLITDLPAMAIATDRLDPELVASPRRWDVRYIRDSMLTFGLVSSVFDYLTFGLLLLLAVPVVQFRTGWFLESVLTEIFVLLVIRTRRPFYRSAPSGPLIIASCAAAAAALLIPWLPGASVLGFGPIPPLLVVGLLALTTLLLIASERAKRAFQARHPVPMGLRTPVSGAP
jgi:Mg2+-importing ATPase